MSEIYLVRHAQACFGESNYDRLSPLGHRQSAWLGEHFRFRELRFDRIVCGDMVRHHETLDGICKAMGIDSAERLPDSRWNEFDFESLVTAYVTEHPDQKPDASASAGEYSRLLRKTMQAWADGTLPGRFPETWAQFEQRVREGLAAITQSGPQSSKTLVVSSGGAIAMAIRQVLAAPPEAMIQMNIQVRNSAFSHLFFNRDSIHLSGFNHVPHLDHPERGQAVTYF